MRTSPEHAPGPAKFDHGGVIADPGPRAAGGSRWALVVSRFNGGITEPLFAGAIDTIIEAGGHPDRLVAITVPGCLELPLAARELAETSHYAGIVALGCVIRGETPHFEYVCAGTTDGLMRVQLDYGVPIGFGIVTADTVDQAKARASREPKGRNVGCDAALAALELAGHVRVIRSS